MTEAVIPDHVLSLHQPRTLWIFTTHIGAYIVHMRCSCWRIIDEDRFTRFSRPGHSGRSIIILLHRPAGETTIPRAKFLLNARPFTSTVHARPFTVHIQTTRRLIDQTNSKVYPSCKKTVQRNCPKGSVPRHHQRRMRSIGRKQEDMIRKERGSRKKPEGGSSADYFSDEPPSTNVLRVFAGDTNRLCLHG